MFIKLNADNWSCGSGGALAGVDVPTIDADVWKLNVRTSARKVLSISMSRLSCISRCDIESTPDCSQVQNKKLMLASGAGVQVDLSGPSIADVPVTWWGTSPKLSKEMFHRIGANAMIDLTALTEVGSISTTHVHDCCASYTVCHAMYH